MDIVSLYKKFIECHQDISTDTRTMSPGSLFFAWKGENFDGNLFAQKALENGARYVIIDNPEYALDNRYILVEDTLQTLEELAHYHRKQFTIPIIAIGGSNGKTTTKELIARVLETQKNVVASIGSLNNHVGVPKTLLRITRDTDIAVVEIGANHLGEIAHICTIAEPTHGLITNIGRDHIGLFGGIGAVIESNLELYTYLKNNNGHLFVDKNNQQLLNYSQGLTQTRYGAGNEISDFVVSSFVSSPFVSLAWKNNYITTSLTGEYNIENIAAAIAIGVHFNITEEGVIRGINSYIPSNNRSQIITTEDNIIVKDFYNANRSSMELALDNLEQISWVYPEKQTIAIIGDMLELGEFSHEEHQAVVDYALLKEFDKIILVGPDFAQTQYEGCNSYKNVEQAISDLEKSPLKNSIILLKASNGTNFTKLFNELSW